MKVDKEMKWGVMGERKKERKKERKGVNHLMRTN